MNISIFGLGYVGCVGMGCMADMGHNIIGVDVSADKVALINSGQPTIIEKDIDKLISDGRTAKKIEASDDSKYAVLNSEVSFICVGTPNDDKGHLDMSYINKVAENIGKALKEKSSFHVIAIRSTVMPGTNKKITSILEESSGKKCNEDFAVISNPEFLREGSAVYDFFNPPYILIASNNKKAIEIMTAVYDKIDAEIIEAEIEVGETIKFINNTFHALKISFANEVGRICKKLEIDSHKLMDIFCKDKLLNISSAYLKPGFAYGGSCLPKDLMALYSTALDHRADVPIIKNIAESNDAHIKMVQKLIESKEKRNIGFLGISFKAGTDDLRYSPALGVVEYFIGKGYNVKVFDSNINLSKLVGKNKEYLLEKLPHISDVLYDSIDKLVEDSDLIIVANNEIEFTEYFKKNEGKLASKKIIDIVRINEDMIGTENYDGVCW